MFFNRQIAFVLISSLATSFEDTSGIGVKCIPDELSEGPTCASFYKCVEGRLLIKSKKKFDCPPGTRFDSAKSRCIYDFNKECLVNQPQPPTPLPPLGGVEGSNKPPASIVPGFPAPPGIPGSSGPPGPSLPVGGATNICQKYTLDPESVYDCVAPGFFPSSGECSNFYVCFNTMGCILKGLYVGCPKNYLYDQKRGSCLKKSESPGCQYVQDAVSSPKFQPVIQLKPTNMDGFFKATKYWELMAFVPSKKQISTRPNPADVARGSKNKNFRLTRS